MNQVSKTLFIKNKLGLHARAATQLVQLAQSYTSEIMIVCGGKTANANSVMGLLLLSGATGTEIEVKCQGEDAQAALEAVEALINARFHEGE
ncbi:HPr family phosphocarrier protein [Catenovulum sp. 2E275]|uniref:HPr family phosphocarrier protein n=1 Tax=Catenovulum sp. 2E275 TaxID=2980497 RepID=UPI0021CE539E|nr:HPr family phosphocarrier protein [Catenovulum sp. 2E275]MCU4675456.1 HPr family phosphocarrier protein [Catenovulum sp. 2E275]